MHPEVDRFHMVIVVVSYPIGLITMVITTGFREKNKNIVFSFRSVSSYRTPRKQAFDPKLIVSDAEALNAWERDPLVSRGKCFGTAQGQGMAPWMG